MWGWAGCCGVRGSFSAWLARGIRGGTTVRLRAPSDMSCSPGLPSCSSVAVKSRRSSITYENETDQITCAGPKRGRRRPSDQIWTGRRTTCRKETETKHSCEANRAMQRPQHIRRHVAAATTHKASAPTCGVVGGSGPSSVGALVMRSLAGVRGDGGGLGGQGVVTCVPHLESEPKMVSKLLGCDGRVGLKRVPREQRRALAREGHQ